jgi:apolipoprotein N-acyltransferase
VPGLSALRFAPVAALLGAASVAGFAPLNWFAIPVLALAGLFLLWHKAETARQAALTGYAFGLGMFGAGVSWVYVSLHDFGMMPAPLAALATALFCAYLALHPALAGWMLLRLRPRLQAQSQWRMLAAAPCLWVLSEWLRLWVFTGFPWIALGYSQLGSPLSGFAPVLGVYGVSLAASLAAALIAMAMHARGPALVMAPISLVVLLTGGYGLGRIAWTAPVGEPVTVRLLQGNVAQEMKFVEGRYEETLETYARLAAEHPAKLIVMPETAVPRFLDAVSPAYLARLKAVADKNKGDLLMGVPARDAAGRYYNAVIALGGSTVAASGQAQSYAKSHLVPFGEFIPPGFGWIINVLKIPLSDFSPGGADQKPLRVAGQRVAVNICYEDAFGEEIIRQLPEATLLANVSNVAWFGDSLAPEQHLDMSRMRAIETGRVMLRATNTGVTAIIDTHGNVSARLAKFSAGALEGTVSGYSGATPYVRAGNYPVLLLCVALLGWIAFSPVRRRSR